MKKILLLLNPKQKRFFFLISLLSIPITILETLGIAIFLPYIQIILSYNENNILNNFINLNKITHFDLIFYSTIILILFFIFKNAIIVYFNFLKLKFSENLKTELAYSFLKKYLSTNYSFFIKNDTAKFIREINDSVPNYVNTLRAYLDLINYTFFLIVIFIIIIFSKNFNQFFYLITFTFLLIPIYIVSKSKLKTWGTERVKSSGKLLGYLIAAFSMIREIKILSKYKFFEKLINNQVSHINILNLKKELLISSFRYFFEIFAVIILSLYIKNLVDADISNENLIITIGIVVVAFSRLIPILNLILSSMSIIKNAKKSVDLVYEDFFINTEFKKVNEINDNKTFNNLELKNIYFSFNDKEIFKDLNFKIRRGDKIFISGDSGIGKSTFINILLGFLKPTSGKILIDDIDINEDIVNFRSLFGYVPQEIHLIDDTLERNITLNIDDKTNLDFLENSLKISKLKKFVETNSIKYQVGERGSKLSGGQIKRLGLARSLYNLPKILIIDEGTSGIDIQTEEEIINELVSSDYTKNMTIIFIAHKLNLKKYFKTNTKISNKKILLD